MYEVIKNHNLTVSKYTNDWIRSISSVSLTKENTKNEQLPVFLMLQNPHSLRSINNDKDYHVSYFSRYFVYQCDSNRSGP